MENILNSFFRILSIFRLKKLRNLKNPLTFNEKPATFFFFQREGVKGGAAAPGEVGAARLQVREEVRPEGGIS